MDLRSGMAGRKTGRFIVNAPACGEKGLQILPRGLKRQSEFDTTPAQLVWQPKISVCQDKNILFHNRSIGKQGLIVKEKMAVDGFATWPRRKQDAEKVGNSRGFGRFVFGNFGNHRQGVLIPARGIKHQGEQQIVRNRQVPVFQRLGQARQIAFSGVSPSSSSSLEFNDHSPILRVKRFKPHFPTFL